MKLLIAGDFAPVRQFNSSFNENLFDTFSLTKDHDFALLNLEAPLTNINLPIKKTGPNLSMDPRWARVIAEAGFNAVSLANNHILDMGAEGLQETINHCTSAGLKYFGAGQNIGEAIQPLILEHNQVKIGLLALSEYEFTIASETTAGAAPIDPIDNYYAIENLKREVDKIILILHAGNEFFPYPRPGLMKLCHYYVDLGISGIVCHHAHVPLGYEVYNGSPIFYGTGNFYFPHKMIQKEDWNRGYLVSLDFNNGSKPFMIYPYHFDDRGIGVLEKLDRTEFLQSLEQRSKVIEDEKLLANKWEEFCRERSKSYIMSLITNNKIERFFFHRNLLTPKMFPRKLLLLLNYLRCDSHREALVTILKQAAIPKKFHKG